MEQVVQEFARRLALKTQVVDEWAKKQVCRHQVSLG